MSIVIPAYREKRMIGPTLKELANFLKQHRILTKTEVIVVAADGGDGTAHIAQQHSSLFRHFKVVEPGPRVGKGRDVRAGMQVASGKYRLFTDADLATPLHHILPMIERLEAGADVVIGVRNLRIQHNDVMRRWSSRLSNLAIQVLAVPGVKDTQCGFKGFRADAAEKLFGTQTIMGWGFDIELLALAQRYKMQLVTMEIIDWTDPKGEQGLVGDSQIKAMVATLRELVRVRINMWRGIYK